MLAALPFGAACAVGTSTEAASKNPNANETVLFALIRNTSLNEVHLRLCERSDASDQLSRHFLKLLCSASPPFHGIQKKGHPGHFRDRCAGLESAIQSVDLELGG
ncbi:hypothetical protein [Lentzea waywayandensis]|uniref:hypothetical protein n=1 Tax=Lentzea waywayandensis TaxID=84724 RepID=UPI0015A6576E|nr:hypothetical protein [Lentzea waywayandensis]